MKQVAIICALMGLLCVSTLFAQGQTPNATTPPPQGTQGGVAADPAITATRVRGEVTAIDPSSRQLTIRTAAGNVLTVQLGEQTTYQRMPVGETALDKAVKIALTDIALVSSMGLRAAGSRRRRPSARCASATTPSTPRTISPASGASTFSRDRGSTSFTAAAPSTSPTRA